MTHCAVFAELSKIAQSQIPAGYSPVLVRSAGTREEEKIEECLAAGSGTPRVRPIKLGCLHYFLQPFFHVFRRHIFHVSGNSPQMSEWILNEARAVAVKLVLNRFQNLAPLASARSTHAVDVGKNSLVDRP